MCAFRIDSNRLWARDVYDSAVSQPSPVNTLASRRASFLLAISPSRPRKTTQHSLTKKILTMSQRQSALEYHTAPLNTMQKVQIVTDVTELVI